MAFLKANSTKKFLQALAPIAALVAFSVSTVAAQPSLLTAAAQHVYGGSLLLEDGYLPEGSVIAVPLATSRAVWHTYWSDGDVHDNALFIENVSVSAIPGQADESLKQFNTVASGFAIPSAALNDAALVGTAEGISFYKLPAQTPIFRNDGVPNQFVHPIAGKEDTAPEAKGKPEVAPSPKPTASPAPALKASPAPNASPAPAPTPDAKAIEAEKRKKAEAACTQDKFCVPEQHVAKWIKWGVPAKALRSTFEFARKNRNTIKNTKYFAVIDYNRPSSEKRMFILGWKTGEFEAMVATHGSGSDPEHRGMARRLSSRDRSHMTPPGFHRATFFPSPKFGRSLILHGMEGRNWNSADRKILIHAAPYVSDRFMKRFGRPGRSQGCPAVSPTKIKSVIHRLDGSALVYNYKE